MPGKHFHKLLENSGPQDGNFTEDTSPALTDYVYTIKNPQTVPAIRLPSIASVLALSAAAAWIDRGDPAAPDFQVGDFTTDGANHDLDLSGIIPVGTQRVRMFVNVRDNVAGSYIWFRKKGNANWESKSGAITQVNGISQYGNVEIACDANRVVEYQAANATFQLLDCTVVAWYV